MGIIRLILLLTVLGGLTLLLAQNWSPALPLVFLGMRTGPLPLAMWILFSTAAGAATSLFISSLFGLSNYFGRQRQTSSKSRSTAERPNASREEPRTRTASPPPPSSKKSSTNAGDDWDLNNTSEDWDFEQTPQETPQAKNTEDRSNTSEREQPKDASKSDSGYSYSYREPKDSGVGKTESVYDADYRVIIPPYQPPTTTNQKNDDDDWGIFNDDDDFEDGDEDKRRR